MNYHFSLKKLKKIKIGGRIGTILTLQDGRLAVTLFTKILIFNTDNYKCELILNCYEINNNYPQVKQLENGKLICFSNTHYAIWDISKRKGYCELLVKEVDFSVFEEISYNILVGGGSRNITIFRYPFQIMHTISHLSISDALFKPKKFDILLYGNFQSSITLFSLKTYQNICTNTHIQDYIQYGGGIFEVNEKVMIYNVLGKIFVLNLLTYNLEIIYSYNLSEGSLLNPIVFNQDFYLSGTLTGYLVFFNNFRNERKSLHVADIYINHIQKIKGNIFCLDLFHDILFIEINKH